MVEEILMIITLVSIWFSLNVHHDLGWGNGLLAQAQHQAGEDHTPFPLPLDHDRRSRSQ